MSEAIWICGVDEAGRGPLVGAVVAGAVVLDPLNPISGLKDSKRLTPARREALYAEIVLKAKAWGVGEASPLEIDQINILQATMLAMQRAVDDLCARLGRLPDKALIDGTRCKEPAISAASIVAKVTRDRQMEGLHARYPDYGFLQHMGYPTPVHLAALRQYGACPEHRRSFSPVRAVLDQATV